MRRFSGDNLKTKNKKQKTKKNAMSRVVCVETCTWTTLESICHAVNYLQIRLSPDVLVRRRSPFTFFPRLVTVLHETRPDFESDAV